MNKKVFLVLLFIIILSFTVYAGFYGKGMCPEERICSDLYTCPTGESCAPGYYCLSSDVAYCYYPGQNEDICTRELDGTWLSIDENNVGCSLNEGTTFSGKVEVCQDVYTGLIDGSLEHDCYEGSYCVQLNSGGSYCAPPDFSEEHCERVYERTAEWDSDIERCSKSCGDGSCEGVEDSQSCPGDCFFGKGTCPTETCSSQNSCENGYSCAPWYFCGDGVCDYAGGSQTICEIVGIIWEDGGKGFGCTLNDGWSGIGERCDGLSYINLNIGKTPCSEGTFCTEVDGNYYCAPTDYSQNHCEDVYGAGNWDGENCLKYCGDGSCDAAENYDNCPTDCDPFYGKGKCPSGECSEDVNFCREGEQCALGYYCLSGYCVYPGQNEDICTMLGGEWLNPTGGEGCLIDDSWSGVTQYCENETVAAEIVESEARPCVDGSYCTSVTESFCAPPDFSQEHCELDMVVGTWNLDEERCYDFCGDSVCNDHESSETCPVDCTEEDECIRDGFDWNEKYCCGDGVCVGEDECSYCYNDCGAELCCGDGVCQDEEDKDSCPEDCSVCSAVDLMWTDGVTEYLTEVEQGTSIFILVIGNNLCNEKSVDFKIYKDGVLQAFDIDDLPNENVPFNYNDDLGAYLVFTGSDTTNWDIGEGYYFVLEDNLTGEIITNSSDFEDYGILELTGQETCYIDNANACVDSILDEDDPALVWHENGYLDSDCDGIPDCIDYWDGDGDGDDNLNYFNDFIASCAGAWDCSNSPWSECKMVDGEYVALRYVRKCGNGITNNCCELNEDASPNCPMPPSKKSCIQEEEFPFFDWFNVLLVSLMLVSFYFYKFKKFN